MHGQGVGSDTGQREAACTARVWEVILGRGKQPARPGCEN